MVVHCTTPTLSQTNGPPLVGHRAIGSPGKRRARGDRNIVRAGGPGVPDTADGDVIVATFRPELGGGEPPVHAHRDGAPLVVTVRPGAVVYAGSAVDQLAILATRRHLKVRLCYNSCDMGET